MSNDAVSLVPSTLRAVALPAFLATAALSSVCTAGTIRHDRLDSDYRAYANQPQFASVGRYSSGGFSGSHTLIAPQWALTAAHVVDINADGRIDSFDNVGNDTLTWGTTSRGATEIIVPTGINGNPGWDGSIGNGFDIALVRLDSPITTITPAQLYIGFEELGKVITSVGFGQGGTGKTGASGGTFTKRAGDNIVDRFVTFDNGAAGLRWDFDEPSPRVSPNDSGSTVPLDMEYMIAPGDSGGGSFLFENNAWFLAGVHSGTYPVYTYPDTTTNTSTYGDATLITRVSAFQQFIYTHIPELASAAIPEPGSLALLATAGLLMMHRRRA